MKKIALLFILGFFISCIPASYQTVKLNQKKEKFLNATRGEHWRINDAYTFVLKKPDTAYDNWRYIFRNKYSITWHDLVYTIDMIGRYKHVFIIETQGYLERWKYVKYGKCKDGDIKAYYGWILATTVENAEKVKKY